MARHVRACVCVSVSVSVSVSSLRPLCDEAATAVLVGNAFLVFYYIFNVFLQLVGGDCSVAFQFSSSYDGYPADVV